MEEAARWSHADTTGVLGSPRQSAEAAVFDELRRSEYGRLDARGHVYLDYTGADSRRTPSSPSTSRCSGRACSATRTRST